MKHFSCVHLKQAGSTISMDLINKNNTCGVTITLKIILNPYVSLFFNNLKFQNSCLIFFQCTLKESQFSIISFLSFLCFILFLCYVCFWKVSTKILIRCTNSSIKSKSEKKVHRKNRLFFYDAKANYFLLLF